MMGKPKPCDGYEIVTKGTIQKDWMYLQFDQIWYPVSNEDVGYRLVQPEGIYYSRPIKGANVNITIDDSMQPETKQNSDKMTKIVKVLHRYTSKLSANNLDHFYHIGQQRISDIITDDLPEGDLMGSMYRFDTEKVTREITGALREYWEGVNRNLKPYDFDMFFNDKIHDLIEAELADERSEAHVCKCKPQEDNDE